MDSSIFLKLLAEDVWQLSCTASDLLERLHSVKSTILQLSSNGITFSKEINFAEVVDVDGRISISEAGFTLLPSEHVELMMYQGAQNHKDICVEVSYPDTPEAFFINFDLTEENKAFLKFLNQAVQATSPSHQRILLSDKLTPTCPCCTKKQQEVRDNITLHPLYTLLSKSDSTAEYIVLHAGTHTHSLQLFRIDSYTAHQGITHLHGSQQHLSVDLTQIYNLRTHIEEIGSTQHSTLTGYSSTGQIILEIRQEGTSAFYRWGKTLQQTSQASSL